MYLLSLFMIVAGAWILKHFITKDEQAAPLMLVLPAYQVPRLAVMLKTTDARLGFRDRRRQNHRAHDDGAADGSCSTGCWRSGEVLC